MMSQRASGYARLDHEFYRTPRWVVDCLLPELHPWAARRGLDAAIWEPAAGEGHIVNPLREAGFDVYASDKRSLIRGARQQDFMDVAACPYPQIRGIVTNPPYGEKGELAARFVHHALALMKPRKGLVAMLLRVDWDSASTRTGIFRDCQAWGHKIVLLRRIKWDGLEHVNDPSTNHAWFIWNWSRTGPPTMGYAP
jgi:hypothetical protein